MNRRQNRTATSFTNPASPTTSPATVIITYDEALRLFVSTQEHHPFSAEKLLQMLNWRVAQVSVSRSPLGHLAVVVGSTCCYISATATAALASLYTQNSAHQRDFPLCQPLLQMA